MKKVKTLTEILTKEQIEICFTLKDSHLINLLVIKPNHYEICNKAGQIIPSETIAQAIEYALYKAYEEQRRKTNGKSVTLHR